MQDLISRQAAIDAAIKADMENNSNVLSEKRARVIDRHISAVPSVQPEREKGKWTKDCACEICGFKPWYERDIHTLSFCPNCGADMRGEQE